MCQIDWTAIAAWIGALSTAGLLIAAFRGFHVWKVQFVKQRDHDLALKVLGTMEDSNRELDALRAPVGIITDGDVAIEKSSYEDEQRDWSYRKMSARYRARQNHYFTVANKRIDAVHEAFLVWQDFAQDLQGLADDLSEKERQVFAEAQKYVNNLHPATDPEEKVDYDILFADHNRNAKDPLANDPFAKAYAEVVTKIQELLKPKLRLE